VDVEVGVFDDFGVYVSVGKKLVAPKREPVDVAVGVLVEVRVDVGVPVNVGVSLAVDVLAVDVFVFVS
jgi:hypothetical protein